MGDSVMVDTMVLIYGTSNPDKATSPDHKTMCLSSAHVLATASEVIISAVTWFEFLRGSVAVADVGRRDAVQKKLRILALDGAAAAHADTLMKKRLKAEALCPKCLASKKTKPCTKCTLVGSAVQRVNDALIVATADLTAEVALLQSFDGGVLAYAPHVAGCRIATPNVDGPLFERVQGAEEPASLAKAEAPANDAGAAAAAPPKK